MMFNRKIHDKLEVIQDKVEDLANMRGALPTTIHYSAWETCEVSVQFYKGYPGYNIVAGEKFKVIAQTAHAYTRDCFDHFEMVHKLVFMVKVDNHLLEVPEEFVRVIERKKA